ncbi:hypothetical protein ABGB18_32940 [Nonomuraea sp. B12E4]|uniref:protein kinase domain-containing protein n=1 Tax=Nonomuraea sp. B12E4 TaxID=3153564 RepID=UPI00325EDDD8
MEMHPLQPGDPEDLGAHVISGRLTEGPRGVAYLGRESDDLPLRVIKLLRPDPETGGDDVARFDRVQRVSSSHIARALAHGMHGDQAYVVREHVEGRSLAEIVAEDGPLDGDSLERLATGVLTALTAVHLAGITHRGLTPNNVIVASDGPRVTDVDLGEPVGEVGYRAPEQIRGLGYGPSADIFAWGAIVVFAATGKPPFGQDADAVLDGEPEVGDLPERLRRVVLPALSKDVGKRPTTYTALLQLLGDKRGEAAAIATQKLSSMPGAPIEGVPVQGAPVQGVPPMAGPPQWGPQVPQEPVPGGPVPPGPMMPGAPMPSGPMQGGPLQGGPPMQGGGPAPYGPVPGGTEPMQGVPMPPPAPVWGPPQDAPQQPQVPQSVPGQTVPTRGPRRPFPMGLAAAVGALALLSGAALWGANYYAPTQRIETVAAAGDASPSEGGAAGIGGTDNSVAQPAQPQPQQSQPEVTVPWAATPSADPDDVGPMVLPTEWTTPTPPELSTVPTPIQIPTQPVIQPTTLPTAGPATVTVTPVPTPTVTVTPTQSPTPYPPSATPTPTSTETGTPTETATPSPTRTRHRWPNRHSPRPTATVTASRTPTAKPTVTVTAKPPVTVTAKPPAKPKPTPKPTPSFGLTMPATPSAKPTKDTPPTETRNPKNPVAVCGPGFSVQRQQAFRGGETFQLYNNSTGENCVVTMKTVDVGKSTPVSATLEVQGGASRTDSASYEFYAGPVKLPAKGKCVRFRGSVGSDDSNWSNWSNCG